MVHEDVGDELRERVGPLALDVTLQQHPAFPQIREPLPVPALDDFRTYLVGAVPLVSAPDVQSVELTTSADGYSSTTLRLAPAAAQRVSESTSQHIHGRLAILVNGFVISAPVVQQGIDNGILQISGGGETPEETHKRAKKLLLELTTPAPR